MINTVLPDKKEWASVLEAFRSKHKITKLDLSKLSNMSHVTLNKVLDGEATFEQMKDVENAIAEVIDAKD